MFAQNAGTWGRDIKSEPWGEWKRKREWNPDRERDTNIEFALKNSKIGFIEKMYLSI